MSLHMNKYTYILVATVASIENPEYQGLTAKVCCRGVGLNWNGYNPPGGTSKIYRETFRGPRRSSKTWGGDTPTKCEGSLENLSDS
jgi:hypothetical protein